MFVPTWNFSRRFSMDRFPRNSAKYKYGTPIQQDRHNAYMACENQCIPKNSANSSVPTLQSFSPSLK